MRQLVRIVLCSLLLAPLLMTATSGVRAQDSFASSTSDDPLFAPIIDSVEQTTLDQTADITRYTITAELTEATLQTSAEIDGTVEIVYQNHTGKSLEQIPFRLYGNAAEYAEGEQSVSRMRVNGERQDTTLSVEDTVLSLDLAEPLADGDTATLAYSFTSILPTDPLQSYGMYKFDSDTNTYSIAHWFPMLAGWDDVYGWNIEPISVNGDPVYTEAAVFDVTLTAPVDLVVVTSGSEIERESDGETATVRYATGPSRDFVMTASADFQFVEETVGETTVRSWFWPGSEAGGEAVLQSGMKSLELYSDLIGTYPYEEMDLVQVDIGNGAGGVEFPGLMYIGSDFYDQSFDVGIPDFLEFIVVHEVAHQWFYNVIGNNQYQHAFIDESMANYMSIVYFANEYGTQAANQQANLQLRLGYFNLLFQEGDQVVDQPTDAFPTARDYGIIVYGKGALAFQQLRHEIGTDAFFAGLHLYFDEWSYKIAQPSDMLAAFEEASGEDLSEFWTHWFELPNGKDDFDATDLARVLREINE